MPEPIVPRTSGEVALVDLLDRALHKGIVLWGEATISVAGVDLVYLGLKILLASTDTADRMRAAAAATGSAAAGGTASASEDDSHASPLRDP